MPRWLHACTLIWMRSLHHNPPHEPPTVCFISRCAPPHPTPPHPHPPSTPTPSLPHSLPPPPSPIPPHPPSPHPTHTNTHQHPPTPTNTHSQAWRAACAHTSWWLHSSRRLHRAWRRRWSRRTGMWGWVGGRGRRVCVCVRCVQQCCIREVKPASCALAWQRSCKGGGGVYLSCGRGNSV